MLSNDTQATPRPRPPARASKSRKASDMHVKESPPPPYVPAFEFPTTDLSDTPLDTILGSPISMTAQRVRLLSCTSPQDQHASSEAEEWMNEKSREELSALLLKAENTIRERENELNMTSAVCKGLYQENTNLKTHHEKLLERLPPPSPSYSPSSSPNPSALSPSPSQSPHFFPSSFSRASHVSSLSTSSLRSQSPMTPSSSFPPQPQSRLKHNRRISVTTSELTRLANENTELMLKLERLESENSEVDLAGKKKLRKLEKEIQGLREELERTQKRSEELEEVVKVKETSVGTGKDMEEEREKERRKEERAQRARAMRRSTVDEEQEESAEPVRDFAPGGALSSSTSSSTSKRSVQSTRRVKASSPEVPHALLELNFSSDRTPLASPPSSHREPHSAPYSPTSSAGSYFDRRSMTQEGRETPTRDVHPNANANALQHESALISQLLLKIRELEETNTAIGRQQLEAGERMREAQKDVEKAKRLYEWLGAGDVVLHEEEEVQEAEPVDFDEGKLVESAEEDQRAELGRTIRLGSLRKSLDQGEIDRFVLELNGESGLDQESFQEGIGENMTSTTKDVFGGPGQAKTRKTVVGLFDRSAIDLTESSFESSGASETASNATGIPFPNTPPLSPGYAASMLDVPPSAFSAAGHPRQHTLGSELGSEYGDEEAGSWRADNHFRTTSLFELSQFAMGARALSTRPTTPTSQLGGSTEEVEDTPTRPQQGLKASNDALHVRDLTIQPPASSISAEDLVSDIEDEPVTPLKSVAERRESAHARNRRLSQTVRARTHRWFDGRYVRSKKDGETIAGNLKKVSSKPKMGIAKVFEGVVETFTGVQQKPKEEDEQTECARTDSLKFTSRNVVAGKTEKGSTAFMLDVWLWLQFIVIILVFLWAMAKRGPKNVLEEAERRRAAHHAHAR